jgi:CheY-like chemotaxis protein
MVSIVKQRMQISPQILQKCVVVGENTANLQCRAPDFSFLEICHTKEEKRSVTERLHNSKNLPLLPPLVFLEDPKIKGKKLNHNLNSNPHDKPLQISSDNILKRSDEDSQSPIGDSITLMLVDNDEDILFTFKSILAAEGFKVEAFKDPGEALSRFRQVDPSYYNLIVTDIRMPNINGFQLYEKLKEIKSDVRVLFMTAFEIGANQLDSMPSIHESDIIRKPIEEESFVSTVKRAVNIG